MYSADAGVILDKRFSSRSHSFLASGGHAGFFDFLAKFVDFGSGVVDFAEFLLDGLHLLAQQVFALVLADLLLNLLVDFAAKLENFEFFGEFADEHFQALAHAGSFDQLLAQQGGKARQRAGDKVGQAAGIVDVHRDVLQIVGQLRRMADDVAEEILRVALESFELVVVVAEDVRLGFDGGAKERTQAEQFGNADALQTFQEDNHVAVRHLYGFVNFGERADFVEIGGSGIFDPRIKLGHDAQQFLIAGQRVNQSERALSADGQRQNGAWEQDGVANWQDRQCFWNNMFFISHGLSPNRPSTSPKTVGGMSRLGTLDAEGREKVLTSAIL